VQLAYAIGVAEPVSVMIFTNGTGMVPNSRLTELVREHFELSPQGIIKELNLINSIYQKTATYGHFGREGLDLPWERTDKAEMLRKEAGL